MVYRLEETLTFESAYKVLSAGLYHIYNGDMEFYCNRLIRYDSAALAVMLNWRRAASTRLQPLNFLMPPIGLINLAHAYDITKLLFTC